MDVEDIEDLYSKPNSDHERLQFDHVIARVKRKNFISENQIKEDTSNYSENQFRNNFIKDSSETVFENSDDYLSEETDSNFLNFDLDFDTNEKKKTNSHKEEIFEESGNKKFVNKKTYKKNLIKPNKEKNEIKKTENSVKKFLNTDVPGQATIYLKTWGCAHNNSDSEYMAGQLASYGYIITDNSEDADLWLLNSCTVKSPAEQHFKNYILKGLEDGKKVVVAGCVSQSTPNTSYLNNISIVGVQQIDRVIEVVEETLKGNTVKLTGVKKKENGQTKKRLTQLNMPKIRKNKFIEIISINVGCLNECTYCKTKHARGELASYTIEEITQRVKSSIKEGVKEIWLTSEDTGAYGKDLEKKYLEKNVSKDLIPNLPNLLRSCLHAIPKDCRLRLGMTNPPYILEHISEIGDIMSNDERMYKFLHIPVQSGSNLVLEDMKREYTVEEFQSIVDIMRKKVPGITIATDLILGFPTEAEEDFINTVNLIEKNKFPVLFINQFYPRPGTPAAKMQLIPANDVKKRTKKLTEIFHSYFPYENNVGKIYNVLTTELSTDREYFVGHNEFYEQILVPKNDKFLGRILKVKIVSTGKFYMIGQPLNVSFLEKTKLKISKLDENKILIGSICLIGLLSSFIYFKLNK